MAITSLLLLVVPLVLLAIASRADVRRRASRRLLLAVYGLPAIVLVAYSALWRWDATRVVSELHGIAFRGADGGTLRKEVRLRGNRVLIGDVEARRRQSAQERLGTLVFRPAGERGTLSVEIPAPQHRAGLIATSRDGFLGSIELEEGDQLCVATDCWVYADRTFTLGSAELSIPRRQARIPGVDWTFPLPFARPVSMTARTWSVGALAPGGNFRSFVGYSRHGSGLRLVPLDEDLTLRRGGKAIEAKRTYAVEAGERISFYTLPRDGGSFEAPPVVERRSVVLQTGRRSFALDFDTPEVHSLTTAELNALRLERPDRKVVALAMGDAQLVDRSLYFSGVSESVALQASALVELSRFFPRDFRSAYRVISPRGPADAEVGEPAWIGASDLAAIRLLVVRPPLLLLVLALALQWLKVLSATESRFTIGQALIAGALEVLAGARLLFGHRAWAMPPHELEAAELGLVAWMMLPWLYLCVAAAVPGRRTMTGAAEGGRRDIPVLTLAGVLVSMVFCATVSSGGARLVWILCHLVALAIPFARQVLPPTLEATNRTFVYAAAIFCAVRIVLLLFGFKESAMLAGGRVSLSAIYIPAAAVLQGFFLARMRKQPDLPAAFAIAALLWVIPAVLTSDIGLALLNVPVFLLLLFAIDRRSPGLRLALALFAILVAGGPLLRIVLPLISNEETLLSLASESNYARFLHFAAPEQLQALATKRGESLSITSAILQQYIGSGVFGRGYGRSEASVHLGDTALRDFAPAVFVAAEWGLAGTMALLMTYAVIGIAGYRLVMRSGISYVAAVSAGTIAFASIYMILANHELVLLTGKNAYLLGLDSAGDVLETFALVVLIAIGTSALRDEGAMT